MRPSRFFALILITTLLGPAGADVLLVDRIDQQGHGALPKAGMTKIQVGQRFGSPTRLEMAVGNPPISRWVYPNFTVYFERTKVIKAVLHR